MNNLKDIREKRALTQEQLAELSGVGQSTISEYERDENKRPSWPHVAQIARVLKVKPEELFPVDTKSV